MLKLLIKNQKPGDCRRACSVLLGFPAPTHVSTPLKWSGGCSKMLFWLHLYLILRSMDFLHIQYMLEFSESEPVSLDNYVFTLQEIWFSWLSVTGSNENQGCNNTKNSRYNNTVIKSTQYDIYCVIFVKTLLGTGDAN